MCALKIKNRLKIETVTIGATPTDGGTRSHKVVIGGQGAMPFLFGDGEIPHPPKICLEFQDCPPKEWSPHLEKALGHVWGDPVEWARFLTEQTWKPLLFLRLAGAHPDYGDSVDDVVKRFERILSEIKAPLVVVGCGVSDIDALLMPRIAKAASGEKLLLGNAQAEHYREIASACIEHGHSLITESPIDINIAKQVNILVQDAGLPPDRVVMYATTGALGYGLEYAYSIMEKTRLAGLEGDKYMNKPQVAFVGQETWRAKEANTREEAGIMWEAVTSGAYLQSGADLVVVRHPESAQRMEEYINSFTSLH